MIDKGQPFGMIPLSLFDDPRWTGLTGRSQALMIALLALRNSNTDMAWPTGNTLAKMLGIGRRRVVDLVEELREARLIETKCRRMGEVTRLVYSFPALDRSARYVTSLASNQSVVDSTSLSTEVQCTALDRSAIHEQPKCNVATDRSAIPCTQSEDLSEDNNTILRSKVEIEKINLRIEIKKRIRILTDVGLSDEKARIGSFNGKGELWPVAYLIWICNWSWNHGDHDQDVIHSDHPQLIRWLGYNVEICQSPQARVKRKARYAKEAAARLNGSIA